MNSQEIGDQIRRLRRERGISQTELAEKLNISFQQVQKYENGKSKISVDRIFQIVEVLNIPLYDLVDRESFYSAAETVPPLTGSSPLEIESSASTGDTISWPDDSSEGSEQNLEYSLIGIYRAIHQENIREDFLKFLETLASILE